MCCSITGLKPCWDSAKIWDNFYQDVKLTSVGSATNCVQLMEGEGIHLIYEPINRTIYVMMNDMINYRNLWIQSALGTRWFSLDHCKLAEGKFTITGSGKKNHPDTLTDEHSSTVPKGFKALNFNMQLSNISSAFGQKLFNQFQELPSLPLFL